VRSLRQKARKAQRERERRLLRRERNQWGAAFFGPHGAVDVRSLVEQGESSTAKPTASTSAPDAGDGGESGT
jgi:hypothetical protein